MCTHQLYEQYLQTTQLLSPALISYYHLKSVKNFIRHFDKIGDENAQSEIRFMVRKYLDEVKKDIGLDKVPIAERIELFNEFVYPIAKLYEKKLGFSVRIKPWIFLGWILMGNGVVFIIGGYLTLYLIFNLGVGAYYIQSLIYQSKGFVYGFDY